MSIQPSIPKFPDSVRTVIDELSHETTTDSIWLIGSRANSCATETSDWDFLIFSNAEPGYVEQRRRDIDLLRVGPSGRVLTDGGEEIQFRDFDWKLVDDDRASYIGKTFRPSEPRIAHDVHEWVFEREQMALLIHRNLRF